MINTKAYRECIRLDHAAHGEVKLNAAIINMNGGLIITFPAALLIPEIQRATTTAAEVSMVWSVSFGDHLYLLFMERINQDIITAIVAPPSHLIKVLRCCSSISHSLVYIILIIRYCPK